MSELVSKVNTAFDSRLPRVVDAFGWGMTLFIYPLTMLQLETINKETSDFRRALRTIIVRAKTEDGKSLFDEHDFNRLMTHGVNEYGPTEILKIAQAVNSDQALTADEEIEALEEK
jgi:hypothetical protein